MPRKSTRNQADHLTSATEAPKPVDIFERARNLIHGERQQDYGDKLDNFSQIAAFWNAQLARKLTAQITPAEVGMMMIGLKLARLSKSPTHYDALLDVAGYAGCLEQLLIEDANGEELPGILGEISASSLTDNSGEGV